MSRRQTPPEPAGHIHDLVPHCKQNDACPWVACRTCGFYATLDGRRFAYRDGYGPGDPRAQKR